mmetsp:Transcript_85787/g.223583  ORF Transcript_85787/g.223583 Transcript_85787/m.223583 type:complete len:235 (+) Transcript_85787:3-707(+)
MTLGCCGCCEGAVLATPRRRQFVRFTMYSATAMRGSARAPKRARAPTASALRRSASALAPSRPRSFTYVVLSVASSLPAVLPSCSELCVTSKMSSATWKAKPTPRAYFAQAAISSSVAPASTAPPTTAISSKAAVLCSWIHCSSSIVAVCFASHSRSMTCPPARPTGPTDSPNRRSTSNTRSAGTDLGVALATCVNDSDSKASPARTATSSPYTLWLVGIPRRISSLSRAGRSS